MAIDLKETPDKAKSFKDKHGLTMPIWSDKSGSVFPKFGQRGIPTNVVIGKDGKLKFAKAGFDLGGIKAAIDKALAEK